MKHPRRQNYGGRAAGIRTGDELLELIAAKQVSPAELAEVFFDRIARLDPQLNSFLLLTRDLAMEQRAPRRTP